MKKRYFNFAQLLPTVFGVLFFTSPAWLHLPSLNEVEYGRHIAGDDTIVTEVKEEEEKKDETALVEEVVAEETVAKEEVVIEEVVVKEDEQKEEEEVISLKSYHQQMLEYRKEMQQYHCKVEKTYSALISGMQGLLESQMQVTNMMNQFNLMSLMMSMQMRYDQNFYHNRSNIIGNPLDAIFNSDPQQTQHVINNYNYYQNGTGEIPVEGSRSPAIAPEFGTWNEQFNPNMLNGIYGINLDGQMGITPDLDLFEVFVEKREAKTTVSE